MSRELLIMRHAESGWDAASDFERTLTVQGQDDATRMGAWLSQQSVAPDYVLASPAQRIRETVAAVSQPLSLNSIHWEPAIYEASLSTLQQLLLELPATAEQVLLVGHNPGVAELALQLSGGGIGGFSPATIAWLSFEGETFEQGKMKQLISPAMVQR